jgi:hypothetical protein
MSRLAIVATVFLAAFGGGPFVFAEEAISEPRCVCGMSTAAEMLNPGHPIFSDLANGSGSEGDSGIADQARTPQTSSRYHRRFPAADTGSTAYVAGTTAPAP